MISLPITAFAFASLPTTIMSDFNIFDDVDMDFAFDLDNGDDPDVQMTDEGDFAFDDDSHRADNGDGHPTAVALQQEEDDGTDAESVVEEEDTRWVRPKLASISA